MGKKLSGKALAKFEAKRDVWKEVLEGVKEIKAGGGKRTSVQPTSQVVRVRLKSGLSHDNFYGAMLHGRVAYHDFEGVTVDPGEKERLLRDIGDKPAVILRNHGLLAWGASIAETFLLLWTLQRACDVQIASSAAGELYPIRPEVFEQTVREGGPAEKRTCDDVFAAMVRLVEAKDPSFRD